MTDETESRALVIAPSARVKKTRAELSGFTIMGWDEAAISGYGTFPLFDLVVCLPPFFGWRENPGSRPEAGQIPLFSALQDVIEKEGTILFFLPGPRYAKHDHFEPDEHPLMRTFHLIANVLGLEVDLDPHPFPEGELILKGLGKNPYLSDHLQRHLPRHLIRQASAYPGLPRVPSRRRPQVRPLAFLHSERLAPVAVRVIVGRGTALVLPLDAPCPSAEWLSRLVSWLIPRSRWKDSEMTGEAWKPAPRNYQGTRNGDLAVIKLTPGRFYLQYVDGKEKRVSRLFSDGAQNGKRLRAVLSAREKSTFTREEFREAGSFPRGPSGVRQMHRTLSSLRTVFHALLGVDPAEKVFHLRESLRWTTAARKRVGRVVWDPLLEE